jgi:hypothetical protein
VPYAKVGGSIILRSALVNQLIRIKASILYMNPKLLTPVNHNNSWLWLSVFFEHT